jgi:hypothetical protein
MGAGDEKGTFTLITPENVMRALKVPKIGKIYRLGMPNSNDMPKFGSRTFAIHIPGSCAKTESPKATRTPIVYNAKRVWIPKESGGRHDGEGPVGWRNSRDRCAPVIYDTLLKIKAQQAISQIEEKAGTSVARRG